MSAEEVVVRGALRGERMRGYGGVMAGVDIQYVMVKRSRGCSAKKVLRAWYGERFNSSRLCNSGEWIGCVHKGVCLLMLEVAGEEEWADVINHTSIYRGSFT